MGWLPYFHYTFTVQSNALCVKTILLSLKIFGHHCTVTDQILEFRQMGSARLAGGLAIIGQPGKPKAKNRNPLYGYRGNRAKASYGVESGKSGSPGKQPRSGTPKQEQRR